MNESPLAPLLRGIAAIAVGRREVAPLRESIPNVRRIQAQQVGDVVCA